MLASRPQEAWVPDPSSIIHQTNREFCRCQPGMHIPYRYGVHTAPSQDVSTSKHRHNSFAHQQAAVGTSSVQCHCVFVRLSPPAVVLSRAWDGTLFSAIPEARRYTIAPKPSWGLFLHNHIRTVSCTLVSYCPLRGGAVEAPSSRKPTGQWTHWFANWASCTMPSWGTMAVDNGIGQRIQTHQSVAHSLRLQHQEQYKIVRFSSGITTITMALPFIILIERQSRCPQSSNPPLSLWLVRNRGVRIAAKAPVSSRSLPKTTLPRDWPLYERAAGTVFSRAGTSTTQPSCQHVHGNATSGSQKLVERLNT